MRNQFLKHMAIGLLVGLVCLIGFGGYHHFTKHKQHNEASFAAVSPVLEFDYAAYHIPPQLGFLTDYVTYKDSILMTIQSTYLTRNGKSTPIFYPVKKPMVSTVVDVATASLEYRNPPLIEQNGNQIKVNKGTTYNILPNGTVTVYMDSAFASNQVTQLTIAGVLSGKTVSQVVQYFGSDFDIEIVKTGTKGLLPLAQCDGTETCSVVWGKVKPERVVKDCESAMIWSPATKRKPATVISDPYKIHSVNDFKTQYWLFLRKAPAGQYASVFPLLEKRGDTLVNVTVINKQPYQNFAPGALKNAAGYACGRYWKLKLLNEPTPPLVMTDADYINNTLNVNDWIHVAAFDRIRIVPLPANNPNDGYIDEDNGIIYYRTDKSCVVWFCMTQAPLSNPNLKTYEYDVFCKIRPDGSMVWRRNSENLPQDTALPV